MPKAVDTVAKEILDGMTEKEKTTIRFTKEADLIQYLHNWGRQIRNKYQLWQNSKLVAVTGEDHPDDASMVIIQKVYQSLKESEPVLDAGCPSIGTRYHPKDWNIPYTPACEECGLPFYKHEVSGDWVHPYYVDGKWVGLPEKEG